MSLDKFLVSPDMTVIQVMNIINENAKGIAFICDSDQLIGTVTDGDVRRYILGQGDLNENIMKIANCRAVWLGLEAEQKTAQVMAEKSISAVPILNHEKKIVKIYFKGGLIVERKEKSICSDIPLVIMAGGKGTRLKPFTDILPKPLIPIGEKTITERIIDKFLFYGCDEVHMIINYKKDFIKAYFQDNPYGSKIHFVNETGFMGTGGGLKLLEGVLRGTFFLSNCDILVDADYDEILRYHRRNGNVITMVCAQKQISIPYGTICVDQNNAVTGLQEKPSHTYLVNTGFYLVEPEVIGMIPENTFIHITEIIELCLKEKKKVGAYSIADENWMDMGQFDEMEKMKERLGL